MNQAKLFCVGLLFCIAIAAYQKRGSRIDQVSSEPSSVPSRATTRLASDGLSPLIEVAGVVFQRLNLSDLMANHGNPIFVIVLRVKNTGQSEITYDSTESVFFRRDGVGKRAIIEWNQRGDRAKIRSLAPGQAETIEFTESIFVRHELLMSKDDLLNFSIRFLRNGVPVSDRFVAVLPDAQKLPLQSDLPNQGSVTETGKRSIDHPIAFNRLVGE